MADTRVEETIALVDEMKSSTQSPQFILGGDSNPPAQEQPPIAADEDTETGDSTTTETDHSPDNPQDSDVPADSEEETSPEVPLLQQELLDYAATTVVTSPAYEPSSSYAQPPKLEVIAEHEILETPAPAPVPTSATSPVTEAEDYDIMGGTGVSQAGTQQFHLEASDSTGDLERYNFLNTPRGSTADYLEGSYLSEPTLPKNYTAPSSISNVIQRVGTFTRRLFGSTTVTPSDSLVSLDFVVSQQGIAGMQGPGQARILRRAAGNMSSRNSVSSDASSLHISAAASARRKGSHHRRRPPVAPPTGEVLSRSRRFLRGGTGGFLHAKGTSAISLRPPEPNQGLPFPCGECPHCRKFLKMGEPGISLQALGHSCPCRICTILEENSPGAPAPLLKQAANRGKTPGGLKPSLPSDYGIFCEACNQSGYMSPDARCSRLGSMSVQGSMGAMASGHGIPGLHPHVVITGNLIDQPSGAPSMESLATNRQLSIRDQACQVSRPPSMTSVGTGGPACRICHSPADKDECLISPCRCCGTLKWVHMSCLVHWLEISCRKLRKPPQCELCRYRYQRRKVLKLRHCSWPRCSTKDKIMHTIFVLSVLAMIFCAAVTIVCFKAEKRDTMSGTAGNGNNVTLSAREVVTLICGVMFFCAFFVAMYVQVKATTTVYKLMVRFWLMNHEWFVDEYRPDKDPEYIKRQKIRMAAIEAMRKVSDENHPDEHSIIRDEGGGIQSRRMTAETHNDQNSDVRFTINTHGGSGSDLDSISATFSDNDDHRPPSEEEEDEDEKLNILPHPLIRPHSRNENNV